jgi:hypothetical protein
MVEIEGKGLDYERYALNRLFHRLVRNCSLQEVLEIPALGEKAMPSIYSIAFAEAGCDVTLINGVEKSRWAWDKLDLPVRFTHCPDITHTDLDDNSFDLAWNFMYLARIAEPDTLLAEMKRLSRRYLMFIGVNRYNPGFLSHRTVHKFFGVEWNHGDINFMSPFKVKRFFSKNGLRVLKTGLVDTPPYPDSLGFRDMKLHRMNRDLNGINWDSRTIHWMAQGEYPAKIKLLYLFERLPAPFFLKLFYAHLFYILAEKQ